MTNGKRKLTDEELARSRDLDDLRQVLSTRQGRRFVWRLLCMGKPFVTTFTGNRQGDFNEGRRSVANDLVKDLTDVGPGTFSRLMDEAEKEAK